MVVGLEKEAIIRQVPLFASLSGVEVQYLAEVMREVQLPIHTILMQEGERGDRFYIITQGSVEVIKAM